MYFMDTMPSGVLRLFIGPMFAGKTSRLIQEVRACKDPSKRVFKHSCDDRYADSKIVSHDGVKVDAVACASVLFEGEPCNVFIDEGQFFVSLVEDVQELLRRGHDVTVSGLDATALGKPFDSMLHLVPHANEVIKLSSTCSRCSSKRGVYSANIRESVVTSLIQVGGSDVYAPMCRKCFHSHCSKSK